MGSLVEVEEVDQVATITLSRPEKRNALKRQTLEELAAAVQSLSGRADVRLAVLRGAGPAFCAGMDLEEMQQRATAADSQAEWRRDSQVYCAALTAIYQLPVPTLAVVQGAAVAGGVGLVLACDLVIAAHSAFFMLPEPQRGITAAMVTPLLVLRVGPGAATHLLLSGRRWSASEAHQFGLCHEVVADDELNATAATWQAAIMSGSPSALALTKANLRQMLAVDIAAQLVQAMDVSAEARRTDDAREGLAAFLEKRPPRWQWRQTATS